MQGSRANYYTLDRLYEHDLGIGGRHFTSFNMVNGCFGGSFSSSSSSGGRNDGNGQDMLLVQSMDGKIQIFENSSVTFTGQLSDCLMPGPMAYIPRMDAFVISNYSCRLECIRYQVLLQALCDDDDHNGGKEGVKNNGKETSIDAPTAVKRAMMEWTLNLGSETVKTFFNHGLKRTGLYRRRLPADSIGELCRPERPQPAERFACAHRSFRLSYKRLRGDSPAIAFGEGAVEHGRLLHFLL